MIKAITFDLDGVYFIKGKENFIANLVKLGVTEAEVIRVFFKSDEMNKKYKTGEMTDEEYWTWAIKEWGLDKSVDELKQLLISGYEVNKQVEEIVKKVRTNGYKALVCTSNFPARINGLQARFHFLDNFDAWVFSYEVGVNKPDKKIFKELVKRSDVKAEEIVYADDYEISVESAKGVGINAFLYQNFEQFMGELGKMGVEL